MSVHKKLKGLRTMNGINQTEMAKYLGISLSAYNLKEVGRSDFNITEIEKIKKFFNRSYEEIFFGD